MSLFAQDKDAYMQRFRKGWKKVVKKDPRLKVTIQTIGC